MKQRLRGLAVRVFDALARLTPKQILVIGWLGLFLYAYPGYMSYDSVFQLLEARSGSFSDGHPPAMSALWRMLDMVVAGPLLVLLLQTTTFLAGLYLLLARAMRPRAAAITAVLLLWFPPIGTVMAVIWKDSIMSGFLILGAACVFSDRRGARLGGLALLAAATAMRHNALAMTFPILLFGFRWSDAHRWWLRFPLAIVAWLLVTFAAQKVNTQLTDRPTNMWPRSLGLLDIVQTLRHMPEVPDAELAPILAGMDLRIDGGFWAAANRPLRSDLGYVDAIWTATHQFVRPPTTPEGYAAVGRAWKLIVPKNPLSYFTYRWEMFERLVQLEEPNHGSATYIWFTDVFDPLGSATKLGHNAYPSSLQQEMRYDLGWIGTTFLFRPYLYLLLAIPLLLLSLRHREHFAFIASGLSGEAGLFILAPTTDYRYSFWLVVATAVGFALVLARRAQRGP